MGDKSIRNNDAKKKKKSTDTKPLATSVLKEAMPEPEIVKKKKKS